MVIVNWKPKLFVFFSYIIGVWIFWRIGETGIAALLAAIWLYGNLVFPWPFTLAGSGVAGTARWATLREMHKRGLLGRRGVIVGRYHGRYVRLNEAGHLATFAPTRSGKGVGQIIPNLLTYPGSVFVTDIKGENYDITHRQRERMGQRVYALDPNRPALSARFNPLDCVRRDEQYMSADAGKLADLLVTRSPDGASAHFDQQAYMVLKGLIMYAVRLRPDDANMGHVVDLLAAPPDAFQTMCEGMGADGFAPIASIGNHLLSLADREKSSVLSTAKGKTEIWGEPQLRTITEGRSSFTFESIKDTPSTVYLIIPPEQLGMYQSFMRVVVGMAYRGMTENKRRPDVPVLFLLDEFPALGYMKALEEAIGVVAGYGVRFWLFCQDTGQLRKRYGTGWQTMVANCAVRSFFGVTDLDTATYVSKALGERTITTESQNVRLSAGGLVGQDGSVSRSERGRALLTPDEMASLKPGKQVLLVQGLRPVLADKVAYFKERAFAGLYDEWQGGGDNVVPLPRLVAIEKE